MNAYGLTSTTTSTSTPTADPARLQTDCDRVHESSERLLQSVWDETVRELSRLVRALGIDAGRVEDLLQDVYLAAWRKRPGGLGRVELRRWLFRVTTNRCHLEHRRRARWRNVWHRITRFWSTAEDDTPQTTAAETEQQALVRKALTRMKPCRRSILVLRYFAELDSKEIGKMLELPDSTVRSRLRTARRELARKLKQAGYDHENS